MSTNTNVMSDDKEYQIHVLSRALDTAKGTIQGLEKKIQDAKGIIASLEKTNKQVVQQMTLQNRIIKQQLQASDNDKRQLQDEILELRAKLKVA